MYNSFIEIWIQSETFGQIPASSIWVIETVSFKLGYYRKDLGKVEEVYSDLHMLQTFGQIATPQIKFWLIETTSSRFG